jgi:hypothetical protein
MTGEETEAVLLALKEAYTAHYQGTKRVRDKSDHAEQEAAGKGPGRAWRTRCGSAWWITRPLQCQGGWAGSWLESRPGQGVDTSADRSMARSIGQEGEGRDFAQEGGADGVIDGTNRRRQRPQDKAAQQEPYTGRQSPPRQKPGLSQPPPPHTGLFEVDPSGPKA